LKYKSYLILNFYKTEDEEFRSSTFHGIIKVSNWGGKTEKTKNIFEEENFLVVMCAIFFDCSQINI